MFDLGWSELLVIAVVAVVVVGPRELPGMLRSFGRFASQIRSMAGDFQKQFNDALKEADLDEVRQSIEDVRKINPLNQMKDSLNPLKDAGESIRKAVEDPGAPADKGAGKTDTKPAADPDEAAKAAAAKSAAAKAPAGSASSGSSTAKPASAKKAPAKKTTAKKTAAKSTSTKSATAKPAASKSATTKKPASKKAAPQKTAPKQTAAKTTNKPKAAKPASSDTAA